MDDSLHTDKQQQRNQQPGTSIAAKAGEVFGGLFDGPVATAAGTIEWPVRFSAAARAHLASALSDRLVWLYELLLYEDFAIYRTLLKREVNTSGQDEPDYFALWWAGMTEADGFERLHDDRPLLTHYRDLIIAQWATNTSRLITRFEQDRAALIDAGIMRETAGNVTAVEHSLSDPHDEGQSVAILGFADGSRVVYKPRPMAVDQAFATLVETLNSKPAPQHLRVPKCLVRDDYGWAEAIRSAPLDDAEGASRFYARAGALLALLQRLRATDFHYENVIASGEYPIPVDLETLFQPMDNPPRPTPIRSAMIEKTRLSFFSTHYVFVSSGHGDEAIEIGGLANDGDPDKVPHDWRYTDPRTGAMRRSVQPIEPLATANLPKFDGAIIKAKDYAAILVDAYRQYHDFLDTALTPGWEMANFSDLPLRWVRRATSDYFFLRDKIRMPDVLSGERDLETLFATDLTAPGKAVVAAEQAALTRLDIPKFMFRIDQDWIWENGQRVCQQAYTPVGPWPDHGWNARSEGNVLGLAIDADWVLAKTSRLDDDAEPLTAAAALLEATRLGDYLCECATMADGRANWHILDVPDGSERLDICPMGSGLYSGLAGPALFLTLLARATGEQRYDDLAQAAIQNLTDQLAETVQKPMPSGGFSGPLSGAYGLDLIASFRDQPTPRVASLVAQALIPEALRNDRGLDIIAGLAGIILIMIRLWQRTGNAGFLDRAEIAGRVLAERSAASPEGLWQAAGIKQPLLGFSHGASGFVYALSQLGRHRPNPVYDHLIDRALRFETSMSARAHGEWPDLRGDDAQPENAPCPSQWCHGSAGVALARVLCRNDQRALPDMQRTLAQLARPGTALFDDLCCGAMGQVMVLDQAGRLLGRDDLCAVARRRAMACVKHAQATGSYRVFSGDMFFAHGLMKGASGIGYALLSLAAPTRIPNILCLE